MNKLLEFTTYWVHIFFILSVILIFFIPLSVWPDKLAFHFWYMLRIIGSEVLWGLVMFPKTKKFNLICPLTTIMQHARGFPLDNARNYKHSFIAELLESAGMKVSFGAVSLFLLVLLGIITLRYVLG